ncbi:MAG TPA: DUF1116 domain-containing protein, partial [Casimicrobiaceae bacterium]|nr:DUF1116 domain-containing protein [Casimicrobiaceae bacterium]
MNQGHDSPDALAVRRMLAVDPCWRALVHATDALDLHGRVLLHAGPPIQRREDITAPVLNSAVMAVLFEGWAATEEAAESLVLSGAIELQPSQDHHVVVPLADVLSPSMWVQQICDRLDDRCVAWSPLNGGGAHVMRVGQRSPEVLAHLRWINGEFAQTLAATIDSDTRLLPYADEGLAHGDDCHGKTAHASAALADDLETRWPAGDAGERCRAFLQASPSFFLNLWMAATKCIMRAAEGVAGSA